MSIKTYAHRGFSARYPENTMIAFKKAVEFCNCDGIELDVHLTKDDKLVVIHDEKVDRTTNGSGYIKDMTLEEVKKLNANFMLDQNNLFLEIPTFDEYCEYISDKNIITNIEIKTNLIYYSNIEEKVINKIKKYNIEDRVLISSFNHSSSIRTKNINKNIPCGFLVENEGIFNCGYYSNSFGMNSYHPDVKFLTKDIVQDCHNYDIGVNTWTVNTFKELKKCVEFKVDGIITNYPNVVKQYIKKI